LDFGQFMRATPLDRRSLRRVLQRGAVERAMK
jgi:hypothetical protein